MVMANIIIQMVIIIRVNGQMVKNMDMGSISLIKDGFIKENGKMGKCMAMGLLRNIMIRLQASGSMVEGLTDTTIMQYMFL